MTEAREVIAKAMLDLKASGKPDTANAYADAILAALSSAGMAVVPVEPSEAMRIAAQTEYENVIVTNRHERMHCTIRAAIVAALPPLASGGG